MPPPGAKRKSRTGMTEEDQGNPPSKRRQDNILLDRTNKTTRRVNRSDINNSDKSSDKADDDTTLNILFDQSNLMKTLKASGYFIKDGSSTSFPNILNKDQEMFLKSFIKDITTQPDYPDNIAEMNDTLVSWFDEEMLLVKCLEATVTSRQCDSARSEHQESLVRLLLRVEDLQPKLLSLLLEKLAETSIMTEGSETQQRVDIPRLILSSIR